MNVGLRYCLCISEWMHILSTIRHVVCCTSHTDSHVSTSICIIYRVRDYAFRLMLCAVDTFWPGDILILQPELRMNITKYHFTCTLLGTNKFNRIVFTNFIFMCPRYSDCINTICLLKASVQPPEFTKIPYIICCGFSGLKLMFAYAYLHIGAYLCIFVLCIVHILFWTLKIHNYLKPIQSLEFAHNHVFSSYKMHRYCPG